jgi:hypothetical protein
MGIYKDNRGFAPGAGLPQISKDLDSVRTYQFEVQFRDIASQIPGVSDSDLTLAAKKVMGMGMSVEAIVSDRVNDRIYYPGKATPEEITITFDNLYLKETSRGLWDLFKGVYNSVTGEYGAAGSFKANEMKVILLDNKMTPVSTASFYGVWPTKWSAAELNYSTNDFHTVDVTFRYDFMDFKKS